MSPPENDRDEVGDISPAMDGWRQAEFPLQGKAQANFLRQSHKVIPGWFHTDVGDRAFAQAALGPFLTICPPQAPSGAHPGAAPCLPAPMQGEAEHPQRTQNLGSLLARLINPSGASATSGTQSPSRSPRPCSAYGSPQGLQPTPACAGFVPARTRFPRLTGCTNALRNALPPSRLGLRMHDADCETGGESERLRDTGCCRQGDGGVDSTGPKPLGLVLLGGGGEKNPKGTMSTRLERQRSRTH